MNAEDQILLQHDFNKIIKWASDWQLNINVSKTKVLVIGNKRFNWKYQLNGVVLEIVTFIKDLGVIVHSNLTFTCHVNDILKRAYLAIRQIFINFKNHDLNFYRNMYVLYVRPILESLCQIWSPLLKFNKDRIENVQRHFTKRIKEIAHLSYVQRLVALNVDTLEERRRYFDLTLMYKITHDIYDVKLDSVILKPFARGHDFNLSVLSCKSTKRKVFLYQDYQIMEFFAWYHCECILKPIQIICETQKERITAVPFYVVHLGFNISYK